MVKRRKRNLDFAILVFFLVIFIGVVECVYLFSGGKINEMAAKLLDATCLPISVALFGYVLTVNTMQRMMELDVTLWDKNPNSNSPFWIPDEQNDGHNPNLHTFIELKNTGNALPDRMVIRVTAGNMEKTYEIPKGVSIGGTMVIGTEIEGKKIEKVVVGCRFGSGWSFFTFCGKKSKNGSCSVFSKYEDATEKMWYNSKKLNAVQCYWGYSNS